MSDRQLITMGDLIVAYLEDEEAQSVARREMPTGILCVALIPLEWPGNVADYTNEMRPARVPVAARAATSRKQSINQARQRASESARRHYQIANLGNK